jgi:hypothetical protein
MHTFPFFFQLTSNNSHNPKTAQIDAAVAHLEAQEELNYTEAGKLFGVHRTTLMRRYTRKPRSRAEANSNCRQRLNHVQEDTPLGYIDTLTKRHIPPTSQIIRNLAEEMLRGLLARNRLAILLSVILSIFTVSI